MARQLQEQGEAVALLALLDCAPSNGGYERICWWRPSFAVAFTRNLGCWLADFFQLKLEEQRSLAGRKMRSFARKAWRQMRRRPADDTIDLEEVIDVAHVAPRELRLWQLHLRLLERHVSKAYCGNVTLFRTRGQPILCSFEEDFGWGRLVAKGVTVRLVPGSHEKIFIEPNVQTLARELETALESALDRSTSELAALQPL
jgi:thioesterase domain-containing protein